MLCFHVIVFQCIYWFLLWFLHWNIGCLGSCSPHIYEFFFTKTRREKQGDYMIKGSVHQEDMRNKNTPTLVHLTIERFFILIIFNIFRCSIVDFILSKHSYSYFLMVSICLKYHFPVLHFPPVSLKLNWFSYRQHIVRFCVFIRIHSTTLWILIIGFKPFTFKVVINM